MLTSILTVIGAGGYLILSAGVFISIVSGFRIWPPGERNWCYRFTWMFWYPATVAFIAVGFTDWESLFIIPPALRIAGTAATLLGLIITFWAISGLGLSESSGLQGKLRTKGLYRYTRNPQYVGDILSAAGWSVITGSLGVLVIAVTASLYYFLLPFSEEPWLREQYGKSYDKYFREVPRFVGRQTVKNIFKDR